MRWTCKRIELFIDEYLEGDLSVRDSFGVPKCISISVRAVAVL